MVDIAGECKIPADEHGLTLRCSSSTQFPLLLQVCLSFDSWTVTLWRWTWVDSWHLGWSWEEPFGSRSLQQ